MGFKGDLSTISMAELFQTLANSGKQGTLVVTDDESRKCIHFAVDGISLLSTGSRKGIRLGEILVRTGKVAADKMGGLLKEQTTVRLRLGEMLVQKGVITEDQIGEAIRFQIEEEIYDLFLWKKARFEFIDGPPPAELTDVEGPVTRLKFDVNSLLMEAVRRADEWEMIRQRIPTFGLVLKGVEGGPGGATATQEQVLTLIDGVRSVGDLIGESSMSRFEVCKSAFDMLNAGAVREATAEDLLAEADRFAGSGDGARSLACLEKAHAMQPGNVPVEERLCQAFLDAGRLPDALAVLRDLAGQYEKAGSVNDWVEACRAGLQIDAQDTDMRLRLVRALRAGGNTSEAFEEAKRIAAALFDLREYAKARDVCAEMMKAFTGETHFALQHGRALSLAGDRNGASKAFDELVARLPNDASIRYQTCRAILDVLSDHVEARTVYDGLMKAGEKKPSSTFKPLLATAAAILLLGGGGFGFLQWRQLRDWDAFQADLAALVQDGKFEEAEAAIQRFVDERFLPVMVQGKTAEALAGVTKSRDESRQRAAADKAQRKKELEGEMDALQARKARGELAEALPGFRALEEAAKAAGETAIAEQAAQRASELERYFRDATTLLAEALALEGAGRYRESCSQLLRLKREFPYSPEAASAQYPMRVVTVPRVARVYINEEDRGESPLVVKFPKAGAIRLMVKQDGYESVQQDVTDLTVGEVRIELPKKAKWRFPSRSAPVAGPAVVGERVAFTTGDGTAYALEAASGAVGWKGLWAEGSPVTAGPVGAGDLAVVGLASGVVRACRVGGAASETAWEAACAAKVTGLAAGESRIVALSADGKATSIDPATGAVQWTYAGRGAWLGRPLILDDLVVAAGELAGVVAIRGSTGQLAWQKSLGEAAAAEPSGESGLVVVPGAAGNVYALASANGEIRWKIKVGARLAQGAGVGAGTALVPLPDGALRAISLDGRETWSFRPDGSITVAPAFVGGRFVFGTDLGIVYSLDPKSGEVEWRYKADGAVRLAPTGNGREIFFGSERHVYSVMPN